MRERSFVAICRATALAFVLLACNSLSPSGVPTSTTSSPATGTTLTATTSGTTTTTVPVLDPVFGSVVSVELLPGYKGTGLPGRWLVGPAILNLSENVALTLGPRTRLNSLCVDIPVGDNVVEDPCFVVAQVDSQGDVHTVRLLHFGYASGTDTDQSWFTVASGIVSSSSTHIVLDDGLNLAVGSDVSIDCASVAQVTDLITTGAVGYVFAMDPETAEVIRVICLYGA